jgi:hypothetical protein
MWKKGQDASYCDNPLDAQKYVLEDKETGTDARRQIAQNMRRKRSQTGTKFKTARRKKKKKDTRQ